MAPTSLAISEKEKDLSLAYVTAPDDVSKDESTLEHNATKRRLLRKLDWHILPLASLLLFVSFLDRINIGNARIAGMAKDLNLGGLKYNIAAAVFFITYCLSEVPSNVALKLFRPSIWIPSITVAWGIVMTLTTLVSSFQGLVIARVFLGLAEGGLFSGIAFYLSLWYPRSEHAMRLGVLVSATALSGAFGGLLAFAIEKMDGIGGLHGWQWIFCLEGLLTTLVAFITYFYMYDSPEVAKFLTESEKQFVVGMLKKNSALATHYDRKFIWQALSDYKTWRQAGIYIGLSTTANAVALFLPTIVNELGFKATPAQLLTIPPYAIGCLFTIFIGIVSDRYNTRGPFIIGSALLSLVGFVILYTTSAPGVGYAGSVIASMGIFPALPCVFAWAGGNAGGSMKKGVAIAVVMGVGSLGGVCSSFIYFQPPRFHVGHGTVIGWLSLSIVLSLFAMWDYNRLNKLKEAQCLREGIDIETYDMRAEFRDMGDKSPLFRYTL